MTTMPLRGATSARRGNRGDSEGPSAREAENGAQNTLGTDPYCIGCGHDISRHRGKRCWTDALGEPLYRTRSLIACDCDGIQ